MERIGPGAHGGAVPAIALTRRGDLRTKLDAFERGLDDIVTLPFAPEELLARVVALARRSSRGPSVLAPVIRVGELEVDILRRSVRAGAVELELTAPEQGLLYLLAANTGRVVTRAEILDALWGRDYVPERGVVDRLVRGLRARLAGDRRQPQFIATVPGEGYRFVPHGDSPAG
jgi:DNA-binding response OmpR family regulator